MGYNWGMHTKRLIAFTTGVLALLPSLVFAQGVSLDYYIVVAGGFLNKFVVPLVIALAFVFFVYNAVRYFIIGGANAESQEKARTLALWGVLAFVFIVSIWGLVNMLVSAFGIGANRQFCPDYNPDCGATSGATPAPRAITPDPLRESVNTNVGLPQEPPAGNPYQPVPDMQPNY